MGVGKANGPDECTTTHPGLFRFASALLAGWGRSLSPPLTPAPYLRGGHQGSESEVGLGVFDVLTVARSNRLEAE